MKHHVMITIYTAMGYTLLKMETEISWGNGKLRNVGWRENDCVIKSDQAC